MTRVTSANTNCYICREMRPMQTFSGEFQKAMMVWKTRSQT